jgi:16S rRNA processing protein RimM
MSELVEIARIAGPFGLEGRMRVVALGGGPDLLSRYTRFFIGLHGPSSRVVSMDIRRGHAVVALEGIDRVSQVETLKGEILYVERSDLPALEDGEYYWRDLLGLVVQDMNGRVIGEVVALLPTGSNDVLEVGSARRILVPFTADVIKDVSLEKRLIVIDADLLEGLLD